MLPDRRHQGLPNRHVTHPGVGFRLPDHEPAVHQHHCTPDHDHAALGVDIRSTQLSQLTNPQSAEGRQLHQQRVPRRHRHGEGRQLSANDMTAACTRASSSTVAILGVLRSALAQVGARLMDAVDPALVDRATKALSTTDGVRGGPRAAAALDRSPAAGRSRRHGRPWPDNHPSPRAGAPG